MAVLGAGWELDNDLPITRSPTFPGLRAAIGRIAEDAIEVPSGVLNRTLLQLLGLFAIVLHLNCICSQQTALRRTLALHRLPPAI